MKISRLLLCAGLAISSWDARAIDWGNAWADPPSRRFPPCTHNGTVYDEIDRKALRARYSGMAGQLNEVADKIASTGWLRRGSGAGEVLYIRLKYRFVCTAELGFAVMARNDARMITGTRRAAGDCDLNIDKAAAGHLDGKKLDRLNKAYADFVNRRTAELAEVRRWHNLSHAWKPQELAQVRTRTDGRFTRTLNYAFCGRPQATTFNAAWKGRLPSSMGTPAKTSK